MLPTDKPSGRHSSRFFSRMNLNHVVDTSIQRTAPLRNALLAEFKSDPVLGQLHQQACDALQIRLDALD